MSEDVWFGLEFERGDDEARERGLDAEAIRERDWAELEAAARDFAKQYGVGALLRCVGRAVEHQKELPL